MTAWADRRELARGTAVVFRREFEAYFDSPVAALLAAAFLLLSCGVFMNEFFLAGVADMSAYFRLLPFMLVPFVPAVTMRVWAEERSSGSFELLMTLPLRPAQLIAGKYAAALCFYLAVLTGSLPIVVMLLCLGRPDLGLIAAGYAGAALLGAFFLAFGVFASGLCASQVSAFVIGTMLGCLFVLTGQERVVDVFDGLLPAWHLGSWLHDSVSVIPRYESFQRGVVATADVLFFGAASLFFLWLNAVTLERARH